VWQGGEREIEQGAGGKNAETERHWGVRLSDPLKEGRTDGQTDRQKETERNTEAQTLWDTVIQADKKINMSACSVQDSASEVREKEGERDRGIEGEPGEEERVWGWCGRGGQTQSEWNW
jgi:hypothetical protein